MVSTTLQAPERADTSANTQHVLQTGHFGSYLIQVLQGPAHKQWTLPHHLIGQANQLAWHGFYKSIGMNQAISHWRLELPDGQEIHLQEQRDHYEVHWDRVSLRRDPFGHAVQDAPGLTFGVILLVALFFGKGGSA